MSAIELLQQAHSIGLKLAAHGEQLQVCGPQDVLESPFIEKLRKHKAELLRALIEESQRKKKVALRERIWEEISREGRAVVVTVKDGRIQEVREAEPPDPKDVIAVWNFRRVQIAGGDWMIGVRDDGKEIAWKAKN